jgi:hypothetical protein
MTEYWHVLPPKEHNSEVNHLFLTLSEIQLISSWNKWYLKLWSSGAAKTLRNFSATPGLFFGMVYVSCEYQWLLSSVPVQNYDSHERKSQTTNQGNAPSTFLPSLLPSGNWKPSQGHHGARISGKCKLPSTGFRVPWLHSQTSSFHSVSLPPIFSFRFTSSYRELEAPTAIHTACSSLTWHSVLLLFLQPF